MDGAVVDRRDCAPDRARLVSCEEARQFIGGPGTMLDVTYGFTRILKGVSYEAARQRIEAALHGTTRQYLSGRLARAQALAHVDDADLEVG